MREEWLGELVREGLTHRKAALEAQLEELLAPQREAEAATAASDPKPLSR